VSERWQLLFAESRPYESVISKILLDFTSKGYEVTVITDNMMGFCLTNKKVELVFLFYQRIDNDFAYCQTGSLLTAILAKELGISCYLFPANAEVITLEDSNALYFAGEIITPKGAKGFIPQVEKVSMKYFAQKW